MIATSSSRAWVQSPAEFTCGSCGERRAAGAPLLRITLANVKSVKLRCQACADEAVPDGLTVKPALDINRDLGFLPRPPSVMTRLSSIRVPLDFKRKAAGD